ncbi:MAG: hypothetical protein J2P41_22250, partial [Blastocatellia bacterium]|nr:hypothetical protein [Blastocatellia bacterium]
MKTISGGTVMKLGALFVLCCVVTVGLDYACSMGNRFYTSNASTEGDIRRTFPARQGGKLIMDVSPGPIEVKTGGDSQIDVEITRKGNEQLLREHEVTFEQADDGLTGLTIRAKVKYEGLRFWLSSGLNVKYVVTVPPEFNIDLKTSGGSITVGDLRGDVRVSTSGGGLRIGKIDGPVIGNTSGGSISLAGCNGETQIKTSGGSIDIGSGSGS